jgi:hypothetical protein
MLSDCVLWKFFGSRKDRKDTQRKTKHMALYAEQLRALEVLWVTQRKLFPLCGTLRALRDNFYMPGTPKQVKKIKTLCGTF